MNTKGPIDLYIKCEVNDVLGIEYYIVDKHEYVMAHSLTPMCIGLIFLLFFLRALRWVEMHNEYKYKK